MTKIAPSILSADFVRLAQSIEQIEAAGADWIHLDVMDGAFVPNITFGQPVVESVAGVARKPLDAHLMVDRPERYIDDFIQAGVDVLSIHPEACVHLQRALARIRELGARSSAALNPSTPLQALEWALDDCDMVLIMSVNPGFGGQGFIPSALKKIEQLRAMIDRRGLAVEIEVDGGVKASNARQAAEAGADVLVVGSGIFKHPLGVESAMDELRSALRNH